MSFNGQRVVVLGGSSGIGLAVAEGVAHQGGTVVIASSRQDRVDAALATLPPGASGFASDLSDPVAVERLFAGIGAFDHLVYTAGENLQLGPLAELDLDAAKRFFGVRFWGACLAAKHAAPLIRPGGSITFTSGIANRRPRAGWAMGASITSAMEGLMRALAVELAPLRVNIVSPGVVETPLWDGFPEADRQAFYQQTASSLLVGHVGKPNEVAEAYLYLMRQSYGTGQVLIVDGGGVLV